MTKIPLLFSTELVVRFEKVQSAERRKSLPARMIQDMILEIACM